MPETVPTSHRTTRTQQPAPGGTLYGWDCVCGATARPRYAAAEDADRAAERHAVNPEREQ